MRISDDNGEIEVQVAGDITSRGVEALCDEAARRRREELYTT